MPIPSWPTGLPNLRGQTASAGSKALHPRTQDTQFDDGPDRSRRRSLFVTTPLNMELVLTAEQFVLFKGFHLNELNTGARRFSAPVLLPDLKTVANRICRISGEVSWAVYGAAQVTVTFTLLVQDW